MFLQISPGLRASACVVKNVVGMLTDSKPRRKTLLADYLKSDETRALDVPPDDRLQRLCSSLEEALEAGEIQPVHQLCQRFLNLAADFYKVERLPLRVLAARPVRSREGGGYELFGDYHPDTMLIRV